MKLLFCCLLVHLSVTIAFAQPGYRPVDQGSSVKFRIKNFGFNSEGSFTGLQGRIGFDPRDLSKASFDVSVEAASVNSDNNMRDNHLRKEEYFDVQNHPRISFVSTAVKAGDKADGYVMTGHLTIKGTTRDISFPFTVTAQDSGCTFKGEFTINRKDFKVGGSSTLSNSLTVQLSVFGRKE